ncbi:hypothetical protein, conserved [Angomonas deanei]|uniref:Uncharacterized protein n=1 Tax=Angomonas deanei TaxID=59799 RepID=A0A7G2C3A3_9TRYP|nr:hypothetical protein, conserved [Angomonas deanei]
MSSESFSVFIDHYILLSMARYDVSAEDDDVEKWNTVSESVQYMLRGPCTAKERSEVGHVDAHHFSGKVCRQRALFLLWKKEERPSEGSFDITRHSIKSNVEKLFDTVRHSLPTTMGDDDEEMYAEMEPADYLKLIEIDNHQLNQTEEERQRQKEVNLAKDLFLSKVQKMQQQFFQDYKRWVDVPERFLEMPDDSMSAATAEKNEREYLLGVLRADRSSDSAQADGSKAVLEALRQQLHTDQKRPSRPSKLSDEEVERLYRNSVPVMHTPVSKSTPAGKSDTDARSSAFQTPADFSTSTTPQTAGRRNRWQVVEYDDDEDGDGAKSSSSESSASESED